MKTWDEKKKASGSVVLRLKIFLTVATSLYLPVSRSVFQVFACDVGSMSALKTALIHLNSTFGASCAAGGPCSCNDNSSMTLLYIIAAMMLLSFTIGFPLWLKTLVDQNAPVGSLEDPNSRYDEDGISRLYTDKMYNDDVIKNPKQVRTTPHARERGGH